MKKHLLTLQSRVQTSGILFAIIASAALVLTASADPTNCTAPPAGLVSWWRGEGNALDQAGTNNGTAVNGVVFPTGKVGQAFGFNGTSSYVQVPSSASLNPSGSFSIETWIYPRQDTPYGVNLLSKWGDLGEFDNQRSYGLILLPGRGLSFAITDIAHQWDPSFQYFPTDPGVIALRAWNHVVAVYDQSTGTRRTFVNGVQAKSRTDAPITIYNGAAPLTFGADSRGGGQVEGFYDGLLDEVSLYNRALTTNEITALYAVGSAGKCPPAAPSIITQPASQTVLAGSSVTFTVTAAGTAPLGYQWLFGGTNIAGATGASLTLTNVQPAQAGNYALRVTNALDSVTSSNALLTVNLPCVSAPAGLVNWWRGESNALDQAGTNNGTPVNGVGFRIGKVGQAFDFNGTNSYVQVPSSTNLTPSGSFSVETWVYPRALTLPMALVAKWGDNGELENQRSYGLSLLPGGIVDFGISDLAHQWDGAFQALDTDPGAVTVQAWNHVVAVYDQNSGTRRIFVDGVQVKSRSDAPITIYNGAAPLTFGALLRGGNWVLGYFDGLLDEVSFYNRALSAQDVQALYLAASTGKCPPVAPSIITQPASQTVLAGSSVTFAVTAVGTLPLSYQWQLNGTNVAGATATSLMLTNVQSADAGVYSVVVTNTLGMATSSNATLTVNVPQLCAVVPAGLVGWWRGEGNTFDQVGTNNGTSVGDTTYGTGRVGQALVFGGADGDGVMLGNPAVLQLQDLSIEAWVRRTVKSVQDDYQDEIDKLDGLIQSDENLHNQAILEKRKEVLARRKEYVAQIGDILTNLKHQLSLMEDTFGLINDEIRARSPEQVLADIEDVVFQTNVLTETLNAVSPFDEMAHAPGASKLYELPPSNPL